MLEELKEALDGLKQVHGRMVQKLMLNPEYRAMVTVETSIMAISGILSASPAPRLAQVTTDDSVSSDLPSSGDDDDPGEAPPRPTPRLATSPFIPRQQGATIQAATMARQAGF